MDKIEELLTRGVDKIYPTKEELEKVLRSGKKLRIYQGFDPTGAQLHIGHMTGLRKLRQWQDLGHHVIFLIGDGTGQAGDPSGKTKTRDKFFTREELRENAKSYILQAGKIVRFDGENPVEILYNGDWLNKLTTPEILKILDYISFSQLAERNLFQERQKKGEELKMREAIYPVLQAYDSVAMNVDVELGGTDQTFNMLMGRQLVKQMQNREKFVMTTPLLTDSKGIKIGKTEGNAIGITDKPEDLYGKIMALPDEVVSKAFEFLTDVPMEEVRNISNDVEKGKNPVVHKKRLAFEIVKQLNDEELAQKAQKHFEGTVQRKEMPTTNILVYQYTGGGEENIVDLLVQTGLANSNSEAKRLIEQGGVDIDGGRIMNHELRIKIKDGMIIKVGKRKFMRIVMLSEAKHPIRD